MKKIEEIWDGFVKYSFWCIFIIGAISLIAYVIFIVAHNGNCFWANAARKISEICIVSVLTSCVLKSNKFSEIFKKSLSDVIYAKEFVKERKDLQAIWEKVSAELFKLKFEEIHDDFFNTITKDYFPNDVCYYSTNLVEIITIQWHDKKNGIISISDEIIRKINSENEEKIKFSSSNTILLSDIKEEDYDKCLSIDVLEVDDESVLKKENIKKEFNKKRNEYSVAIEYELNGKKQYNTREVITRLQNINVDDYLKFNSKFLSNGMTVALSYPNDLKVDFYENGTIKRFKKGNSNGTLSYTYNGLILRKQGYIITFHKK